MAGRIPRIALSLCLIAASAAATVQGVPLAGYSFDDDQIDTGPDTFRVFEHAKGQVSLSNEFPYSGYYSVHLQDAPYDRDFPELQGYFELRKSSMLHFHFAFMVVDPMQALNIALAGPQWFSLKRDGIGFWLSLDNGRLRHMSDSIPKPLFEPQPFIWYVVDLHYAIERGRYDLRIMDGAMVVAEVKDAANAANQPGSVVDKFSFIGDLPGEDLSSVSYFVDDVWISADSGSAPPPFVEPEDFGLSPDSLNADLGPAGQRAFWRLVAGQALPATLPETRPSWFGGISAWREGCQSLADAKPQQALKLFGVAAQALPGAPLPELSRIQALAVLQRWNEVDAGLAVASRHWESDPCFGVVVGQIGFMRGDLKMLEQWWNVDAEAIPDSDFVAWANEYFNTHLDPAKLEHMLQNPHRSRYLQRYVIAEQHFFSLLWRKSYPDAMVYAQRLAEHFSMLPTVRALWLERSGDAAFLGGSKAAAGDAYRAAVQAANLPGALEKLSDLAYLAGDTAAERRYREAVYGSLRK